MCLDAGNRPFNVVQIFRGHPSLCAVIDWHSLGGCVGGCCYYANRTEIELLERDVKHPAPGQVLRQSVQNIQTNSLSACYVASRGVKLVELFSQIEESTNVQTDVLAVLQ